MEPLNPITVSDSIATDDAYTAAAAWIKNAWSSDLNSAKSLNYAEAYTETMKSLWPTGGTAGSVECPISTRSLDSLLVGSPLTKQSDLRHDRTPASEKVFKKERNRIAQRVSQERRDARLQTLLGRVEVLEAAGSPFVVLPDQLQQQVDALLSSALTDMAGFDFVEDLNVTSKGFQPNRNRLTVPMTKKVVKRTMKRMKGKQNRRS